MPNLMVFLGAFWMGPGLNIFLRDKEALLGLECSGSSNNDLLHRDLIISFNIMKYTSW